jgi:hypothetical protein
MRRHALSRFSALFLLAFAAGCAMTPEKPVFQPLSLDLSGDMAPRDPSLPPVPDVYCVAGDGTALIAGQWRPYRQTGFILPGSGAMSSITISAAKGGATASLRGYYDEPGQKMVFCPLRDGPPDTVIECHSLYAMNEDIAVGIKRTFEVPKAILSGHISCAFDQARIQPL